jgi:hypothetical protein
MSPNVAWNGSLESYHPYLTPRKVSKTIKIECIHSRLPKNAKSHFGRLGLLGVKVFFTMDFFTPKFMKIRWYSIFSGIFCTSLPNQVEHTWLKYQL